MTAATLLRPRFEVIADYPNPKNHPYFEVGEFVDTITEEDIEYFTKYPHLFRKMSWWENRDVKDMPMYVMHHDKTIYKIKCWNLEQLAGVIDDDQKPGCICLTMWNWNEGYGYIPIDESLAIRRLAKSKNK